MSPSRRRRWSPSRRSWRVASTKRSWLGARIMNSSSWRRASVERSSCRSSTTSHSSSWSELKSASNCSRILFHLKLGGRGHRSHEARAGGRRTQRTGHRHPERQVVALGALHRGPRRRAPPSPPPAATNAPGLSCHCPPGWTAGPRDDGVQPLEELRAQHHPAGHRWHGNRGRSFGSEHRVLSCHDPRCPLPPRAAQRAGTEPWRRRPTQSSSGLRASSPAGHTVRSRWTPTSCMRRWTCGRGFETRTFPPEARTAHGLHEGAQPHRVDAADVTQVDDHIGPGSLSRL